MTADRPTDFPYRKVNPESDRAALRRYWSIARGLQKVDGLKTSPYLDRLSEENIEGVRNLEETGALLRKHYFEAKHAQDAAGVAGAPNDASIEDSNKIHSVESAREADMVTHRIAELLSSRAFLFAPNFLSRIHAYLFQDLDTNIYHPGEYKDTALQKQEAILNGDSVLYADPSLIEASLKMAFEDEMGNTYENALGAPEIESLARFASRLWQVHPFFEGNTRTVAAFLVLYLNDLGYDATNEPFERDSEFFRDALVRAAYRNPRADAFPDLSFLIRFLENTLLGTDHPLDSQALVVQPLFDNPSLLRNVPVSQALNGC